MLSIITSSAAKLFPSSKAGALFSTAGSLVVLALAKVLLEPVLTRGGQGYTDIISSGITFADEYKAGDVPFALLLSVLTLASFFVFARLPAPPISFLKLQPGLKTEFAWAFVHQAVIFQFAYAGLFTLLSYLGVPITVPPVFQVMLLFFSCFLAVLSPQLAIMLRYRSGITLFSLASFFLPFLPLRLLHLDAVTSAGNVRVSPNLFFQCLAFAAIAYAFVKTWQGRKRPESLLPLQTMLIAAFFAFRLPLSSALQLDSYHTGEMLTPFQQVFLLGQSYYGEFVSVHGLLAVLQGLVHWLFFDGTLATVPYAFSVTDSLFAALVGGLLFLALPARAALLLSFFVLPSWNRFYLFPLVLAVLSAPRLQAKPVSWILTATFLSLFALLFNHAPGLGILLSLAPFILWYLLKLETAVDRKRALVGIVFLLAIFAWPLLGALRFILENGPGTIVAFGLPISAAHSAPSVLKALHLSEHGLVLAGSLFKVFKLEGWLAGCVLLLGAYSWRARFSEASTFIAGFSILFFCSVIPYIFGRVGNEGLDRVGAVTILSLAFALPFFLAYGREKLTLTLLALLLGASALRSFSFLKGFTGPAALAVAASHPEEAISRQAVQPGDPEKLGAPLATGKEIEAQRELARFLNAHLAPNEGYLDLTNSQLLYFVHNRRAPYVYPSHLLAANELVQNRIVNALDKNPPKLVLVSGDISHEHSKAALRSYRVYRWLMSHGYTKVVESDRGTYQFLVRAEGEDANKADLVSLRTFFRNDELDLLPLSWGRGWEKMKKRFGEPKPLFVKPIIDGESAGAKLLRFSFARREKGSEADYLLLEAPAYRGEVRVSFSGHGNTQKSFRFTTAGSEGSAPSGPFYLIPMGTDPTWFLSANLEEVILEFAGQPGEVKLSALKLEK